MTATDADTIARLRAAVAERPHDAAFQVRRTTLLAVFALLDAQAVEVERLKAQIPQWISPQDEMPPPIETVPTLSREKRSTTGWAHSYGSWSDDPDDNSRPDSKMFKARTAFWCKLPELPAKPDRNQPAQKGR